MYPHAWFCLCVFQSEFLNSQRVARQHALDQFMEQQCIRSSRVDQHFEENVKLFNASYEELSQQLSEGIPFTNQTFYKFMALGKEFSWGSWTWNSFQTNTIPVDEILPQLKLRNNSEIPEGKLAWWEMTPLVSRPLFFFYLFHSLNLPSLTLVTDPVWSLL